MNIEPVVRAVQRELGIEADGKAGPQTWEAIYRRLVPGRTAPAVKAALEQQVDDRSERVIATLLPEVQPYARTLVLQAAASGIAIKVISGLRTYDEQNGLYAKGRTAPGPAVTNARGGYSNHNFGIAFDIGVWEGGKYQGDSPKYKAAGVIGAELGLEWGGNWKTIKDQPHFQLRPSWAVDLSERDMLAGLRQRTADAGPIFG